MGQLEKEARARTRNKKLTKVILSTIGLAGLISIALVAPNVVGALGKLGYLPKNRDKELITRARKNLIRKGLLTYEGSFLRLTQTGEAELRRLERAEYKLKKPKRWDKKWRVLIFDIPEKRRGLREKVRRTLITIGFVKLQNSVWLYPYDCEDLITLLKADFKIGKDLLYLIVESLEYDTRFRERFNLI